MKQKWGMSRRGKGLCRYPAAHSLKDPEEGQCAYGDGGEGQGTVWRRK